MKKILNAIERYPFIIVLVIILLFFTPYALFSPGESRRRAIVLAIGLDRVDDEYEISFLTFIPKPNQEFEQSNSVVSGKGSSVSEAILDAQLTLGKDIGLSHAKTTVVNEKMLEEDVSSSLDYLSRVISLPENTVFVCTNTSAKELLMATDSLEKNLGLKLDQLISYNANEVYITDTSLEAFYKGYYSPHKSSLIGFIEHVKEESSGGGSGQGSSDSGAQNAGGQSGGQSGGEQAGSSNAGSSGGGSAVASSSGGGSSGGDEASQSEGEKQRGSLEGQSQILNKADAVVLREGKKVAKLDVDNLNSINLLSEKRSLDSITVENVKCECGKTVDMTFLLKNKQVAIQTDFQNGIPIFIANVSIGVQLTEIDTKGQEIKQNAQSTKISDEIASAIEKKIRTEFARMLKILRDSKADVINVYDEFYRGNRKNFEKFLSSLNDKEDYLNNITFMLNMKIRQDG